MNKTFDISWYILLYVGVCLLVGYISYWIVRSVEPKVIELLFSFSSYNMEVPKAFITPIVPYAYSFEWACFLLLLIIFLTHFRLTD